ncbi:MAG: nitroreductase [Deltaproteobacteria bacterium HGW-Deltaproteobacteria-13]|nr:MAG: nitroreductase [Deltaproteobacteria bacterium HGW-Deltaproteobacteria-13]
MIIQRQKEKCTHCMLCMRDCVYGVWREIDGEPEPVEPDLCNKCSHCIAVCPADAVIHTGLDPAQAVKIDRRNLDPALYRDIVLSRRSVRRYSDKPVPRELIEKIIDTARYSPTGSNEQNVGYNVITDRKLIAAKSATVFSFAERIFKKGIGQYIFNFLGSSGSRYMKLFNYARGERKTSGRDFIFYNAPVLILIHAPKKSRSAGENCTIAATNITNYAHTLGLGTCFIGLFTTALKFSGKLREGLNIPHDRHVYICLILGYPAYRFAKIVSRKPVSITWV